MPDAESVMRIEIKAAAPGDDQFVAGGFNGRIHAFADELFRLFPVDS